MWLCKDAIIVTLIASFGIACYSTSLLLFSSWKELLPYRYCFYHVVRATEASSIVVAPLILLLALVVMLILLFERSKIVGVFLMCVRE